LYNSYYHGTSLFQINFYQEYNFSNLGLDEYQRFWSKQSKNQLVAGKEGFHGPLASWNGH
jgi:hypothetical protein